MSEKQQISFAAAAFIAGVAWGALRYRQRERSTLLAVLQGLEWFVAYGGAVGVIGWLREALQEDDSSMVEDERVTHIRQVVEERTGTEG